MQEKVLLLEDDESIRRMLAINFEKSGFIVYEAATGEEALSVAASHRDIGLSVLDIMLPGINGVEVCKKLRADFPFMGIIMLTARTREQDKINALESGADDYVTKPFSVAELMARVNSLLRRIRISSGDVSTGRISHGRFLLDNLSRKLYKDGTEIDLTPTEFSIIRLFMSNPGKAIDREELLTKIWGEYYFGEMKIVDVNIRRLRKKIEDDPSNPEHIETVWGIGYRWKEVPS